MQNAEDTSEAWPAQGRQGWLARRAAAEGCGWRCMYGKPTK